MKRINILGAIAVSICTLLPISVTAQDIILTGDTVLNQTLSEFIGTDSDPTIYGNGYAIDGNGFAGVNVSAHKTYSFDNITLKNFTNPSVIENAGTVNLISTTLDNVIINNNNKLSLFGENELKNGSSINSTGYFALASGITNVEKGCNINFNFLKLGSSGSSSPLSTLNNYGIIEAKDRTDIYHANINNYGTLNLRDINNLYDLDSIIVNDGTINMLDGNRFQVSKLSKLINNKEINGNIANWGETINFGKIIGDIQNGYVLMLGETYNGTLTSNINDITGTVIQSDYTKSVFNITGGTITDANKITGKEGIVNIVGDVISSTVLGYEGDTYVKGGSELNVKSDISSMVHIFSKGNLYFENDSTLNLKDSRNNGLSQNVNIISEVGNNLNLKLTDGFTLYLSKNAKGNFSLKELDIRDGNINLWQVIDASNSNIYGRTSLSNDLKLIRTSLSAKDINYVTYNKSNGIIRYEKNKTLQSTIDDIASDVNGNEYFYEMGSNESLTKQKNWFEDGRLIIQGNNNTIKNKEADDIEIRMGGQSKDGTLVLNNTNLENVTFVPESNGKFVIRNVSGETINLNNTKINNRSDVGGLKFEGDSNINFNGEYTGISPRATVALNLGNATLTKNGNDTLAYWNLNSGTLKYVKDSYLANSGLNAIVFNGGNLDLRNGIASEIPLAGLVLNANSKIFVDVDLANKTMDKLSAKHTICSGGTLNVAGMDLLSDAKDDFTSINFTTDDNLKSNIEYTGGSEIAYSPIYKYKVDYNEKSGNFEFIRSGVDGGKGTGGGGNASNAFNPSVLAGSVGSQLGSYLTQLNIYEQAFSNMDMLMLMTKEQRTSMKYANRYASLQGTGGGGVITFSPNQIPEEEKGLWFRPFATFESVGLNNGPNVKNIGYGSLFGGDTGIIELRHGWDTVYSAYAGYNGSNQYYNGVSITQNGGTLGLSGTWYKGNFFTGLTANVGANVGGSSTMYGFEDFVMLTTGIASKTGYNWELANGKFIVQPSFLMSYTFVNTFDYKNAAGVDITSDPLNAIQIAPGLKFIGNLKNGWQPYIGMQMVWNVMDDTKFKANDVSLPDMSIDPYFQYGVGVQKQVGDKFTGFGQAMVRNGGRNGIALQFGFRWALGKSK